MGISIHSSLTSALHFGVALLKEEEGGRESTLCRDLTSHSWDGSRAQTHLFSNLVPGWPAKQVNSSASWAKNELGP